METRIAMCLIPNIVLYVQNNDLEIIMWKPKAHAMQCVYHGTECKRMGQISCRCQDNVSTRDTAVVAGNVHLRATELVTSTFFSCYT